MATLEKTTQKSSESFADLFEESMALKEMRQGEVITAEVISIDSDFVIVNAGLKSESLIKTDEFLDDKGDIEVNIGEQIVVTRFHPVSEEYVVARQGINDTFMASVHINNTNVMEVLAQKYVNHMREIGKDVSNPFSSIRFSQIDQNFSED